MDYLLYDLGSEKSLPPSSLGFPPFVFNALTPSSDGAYHQTPSLIDDSIGLMLWGKFLVSVEASISPHWKYFHPLSNHSLNLGRHSPSINDLLWNLLRCSHKGPSHNVFSCPKNEANNILRSFIPLILIISLAWNCKVTDQDDTFVLNPISSWYYWCYPIKIGIAPATSALSQINLVTHNQKFRFL